MSSVRRQGPPSLNPGEREGGAGPFWHGGILDIRSGTYPSSEQKAAGLASEGGASFCVEEGRSEGGGWGSGRAVDGVAEAEGMN